MSFSSKLDNVPEDEARVFTGNDSEEARLIDHDTAVGIWSPNEIYGHDRTRETWSSRPITPVRNRRVSSASRVDVGFFDPSGVRQLRRNLTQMSHQQGNSTSTSERSSLNSDVPLLPMEGTFDFESTLRVLNRRIAAADIKKRELGVVFENLRVIGLKSSASYQPTVGSLFSLEAIAEKIRSMRHTPLRDILCGFEGVVRPGEMLLVLGRPGSGCSTFLKTLADQRDEFHSVQGEVHYDSISPEAISKHYRGDVQYCPEDDFHFPSLTTRGLDSSTALEFGRALRIATDMVRHTTIASLYQVGEPLYQLFDKVCIIHEGRMIYFGPADQARDYFYNMGYEPANRQTTSDFLVAVTDPKSRTLRPDFVNVPHTATEFAEYFSRSSQAEANREDIFAYKAECVGIADREDAYRKSVLAEHAKTTMKTSSYTISIPMQVRAVMKRRVQIILGNKAELIFSFIIYLLQAIIIGTTFLRVPVATTAYFSRIGALCLSFLFPVLTSFAEIPALFSQRPIVLKHQKAAMYHPFVEGLAMVIVDLPISFGHTMIFAILIYFIIGFQETGGQFFVYWLFLFLVTITMKTFFRAVSFSVDSEAPAQGIAGLGLLCGVLYAGYVIPKTSMTGGLRWISTINPLRYGFEAVMVNEFHTLNGTCSSLVPHGVGYEDVNLANQVCATVGAVSGQDFVDGNAFVSLSYEFSSSNLWKNFGIITGFFVGFVGLLMIFTEFNAASEGDNTFVVLFKRGAKTTNPNSSIGDEGKYVRILDSDLSLSDPNKTKKAFAKPALMTDVFSWQHLDYTVPVGDGERKLLDDVSGYVAPGKLTALMGESGAGKTTLLNVLAQRVSIGVVKGDRFVNGQAPPVDFQAQSGYCQQMDTHMPTDTVREALLFSAKLRQPESVPMSEKEAYVENCIKMCGLEEFADAIVGSLGVEQRKRTTIGVELAAKPKLLLFLDEPTSGLDSQSAWAIISFLRNLADSGQAILCTIHQPSAELFQVFDKLLLLRKGGQTVYFGDIGPNSSTLIPYFEQHGSRICDPSENPAEFMLDVIGAGATASSVESWGEIWMNSREAVDLQEELNRIHADGRNRPAVTATIHSEFATSWLNQTRALLIRNFIFNWRNPSYIMAKFLLNVFAGLVIGFTFFKAKDSQQGNQNKVFAVFMSIVITSPVTDQMQIPLFKIRDIYEIRERPSRIYHWTALVTSQFLAEVPLNIIGSTIYFLIWYWLVGFETSRAGYTFLMYGVILPLYYTSFGYAVSTMAPNAQLSTLLFAFFFMFKMTFCGVLQPPNQLGGWKWMYHVTPFGYVMEGLIGQAAGQKSLTCAPFEFVRLNPPSGQTCGEYLQSYINTTGGYVANPSASSACEFCTFATSDQYLDSTFSMFYSHRWRNLGLLLTYVMINIAGIYLLTYIFRIRTESVFVSLKKRISRKK